MEFNFETEYTQKAATTMAKGLRKTVRKKSSRRVHIFGWIIVALAVLSAVAPLAMGEFTLNFNSVVTILVLIIMIVVLTAEDWINGYLGRKRMIAGTEKWVSVFHEDNFCVTTGVGQGVWSYDVIHGIAEADDYFVLALNKTFAQVYDKSSISGGTVEEFRKFISEKTGISIVRI